MTPEGKIKVKIRKLLNEYDVYCFMPVQMGMGAAGLDFHCVVGWYTGGPDIPLIPLAFFIEAKRPGKRPTLRQEEFAKERWGKQKARTFVISDDVTLAELDDWLRQVTGRWLLDEHAREPIGHGRLHVPT
jgi:hypothetical protein